MVVIIGRQTGVDAGENFAAVFPDVFHAVAHILDTDAEVVFFGGIRVKNNQVHVVVKGHVVFCFEDVSVGVELEGVMPEVGVRDVGETGDMGGFISEGDIGDFLGAFPVVDAEFAGEFVAVNHVDGSADTEFFVEDAPFGAVGFKMGKIGEEVLEILEFDGGVVDRDAVVMLFDVEMHLCSGGGCGGSFVFPFFEDGFCRHLVVWVFWIGVPSFIFEDHGDGSVFVEGGKKGMVPCGDAGVGSGDAVDFVDVSFLKKLDSLVAWMGVYAGKVADGIVVVGGWMGGHIFYKLIICFFFKGFVGKRI